MGGAARGGGGWGVVGFLGTQDRPGGDAGRGAAVPYVHERHYRTAEGLSAQYRWIPVLRRRHVEIYPRHPPGGCLLVHGRHWLDYGSLLYRLWAVGVGRFLGGV